MGPAESIIIPAVYNGGAIKPEVFTDLMESILADDVDPLSVIDIIGDVGKFIFKHWEFLLFLYAIIIS